MPATDHSPRPAVIRLVRESVAGSDRVLVTGGSGWFGRTTSALLLKAFGREWHDEHVWATATSTRTISVFGCGQLLVRATDLEQIARFAPTLVVNCAFLTRDKVASLGLRTFVSNAERLTDELEHLVRLPSVERAVTFSSGAAVPSAKYPADLELNPYGVLKAREERILIETSQLTGKAAQVARVWAVSGPHVQNARAYALSGFAVQAVQNHQIVVNSAGPVIRSYSAVEDVVAVALARTAGGSGLFDSGGKPVEIGELAQLVSQRFPGVPVLRSDFDPQAPPVTYGPAGNSWDQACAEVGLQPAELPAQVAAAVAAADTWH